MVVLRLLSLPCLFFKLQGGAFAEVRQDAGMTFFFTSICPFAAFLWSYYINLHVDALYAYPFAFSENKSHVNEAQSYSWPGRHIRDLVNRGPFLVCLFPWYASAAFGQQHTTQWVISKWMNIWGLFMGLLFEVRSHGHCWIMAIYGAASNQCLIAALIITIQQCPIIMCTWKEWI